MKLHSENIAAFDSAGEQPSVFAGGRSLGHHGRMKRMRVIDKRILRDAVQQSRSFLNQERIPADMRRLYRGRKLPAFAGKDPRACDLSAFFTSFEKPLHSQADPQ